MKKYKIELSEEELSTICYAIESGMYDTSELIEIWTEDGGSPPEYLQTRRAGLKDLWEKLRKL